MTPAASSAARPDAPSGRAGKTIVVVEDFPDLLDVTAMLLEGEGYHVLTALDGQEGLRLALQSHADLVLLDYAMPRMNGAEVGRCLRERDPAGEIKIMMNTATPEAQVRRDFCDYDHFLRKPMHPRELVGAVASLLAA